MADAPTPEKRSLRESPNPATDGRLLEGDSWWERARSLLVGVSMVLLLGGLVVYYLWRDNRFDPAVSPETVPTEYSQKAPGITARAEDLSNPAVAIAEAHLAALGGFERVQRLSSIRLRGQVEIQGEHTPFSLHARRPNDYRIGYEPTPGTERVVGYNGHDGWEEIKVDGLSRSTRLVNGPSLAELLADADFDSPAVKYLLRESYGREQEMPRMNLTLLGRALIGNELCEHIRATDEGRPPSDLFFDRRDHRLLRLERPRGERRERIDYSDYHADGANPPIARRREIYLDGELTATVTIDSVEYNPGTIGSLFDPPEGLEHEKAVGSITDGLDQTLGSEGD